MKTLVILLMFLGTQLLQGQQTSAQPPMVTVTGEGILKVVPDEVSIRARIEHEGEDPVKVKKKNDEVVNAVIKYLKGYGVAEKDIKTEHMNLNKRYQHKDKTTIYLANQAISIKLRNLKNYSELMSGLLDTGINRIDGVNFSSSKIEAHRTEARRRAVLDARQKATTYAETLDQSIGKALFISESGSGEQPVYRMSEMKMASDESGQETIAPGEMEVKANVSVGFMLNGGK